MSVLRYLAPGANRKLQPPARGASGVSTSSGEVRLRIGVPNYGIIYLPAPEVAEVGAEQPRDDPMLRGELEVTLSAGGGAKRCRAIRVGLKTVLTLDLGHGRRYEEDVLFERKVEIGRTGESIWLAEGSQRFGFTIIVPANLASHDWHTNGVISHILYAEVEGLDGTDGGGIPRSGSASSLFGLGFGLGLRRPSSRGASSRGSSRPGSRTASPTHSPPLSPAPSPRHRPTRTLSIASLHLSQAPPGAGEPSASPTTGTPGGRCGQNVTNALDNLANSADGNGSSNGVLGGRVPAPIEVPSRSSVASTSSAVSPGGSPIRGSPISHGGSPLASPIPTPSPMGSTPLDPAPACAPVLPRAPSYDDSVAGDSDNWIRGTHYAKRNCMVVYNPNPTGGINELSERGSGYVDGLGMWELAMVSDVWSIGALLSINIKLSSLSPRTTVFTVRLVLNQTHAVVSPRDPETKRESTRTFTLMEEGTQPPVHSPSPGPRVPALWRGAEAGSTDGSDDAGELVIDRKVRLPYDNVARPSTLPGVVTPIQVSHSFALEVAFSVWGETDKGEPMPRAGPGGLRVLRISRPVFVPSCCLVPVVLELPSYEAHAKDPPAPPPEEMPPGLPGWEWCACGAKIDELEARMRQSILDSSNGAGGGGAGGGGAGAAGGADGGGGGGGKMADERGRQGSGSRSR